MAETELARGRGTGGFYAHYRDFPFQAPTGAVFPLRSFRRGDLPGFCHLRAAERPDSSRILVRIGSPRLWRPETIRNKSGE